jgi:hypothetical protein
MLTGFTDIPEKNNLIDMLLAESLQGGTQAGVVFVNVRK